MSEIRISVNWFWIDLVKYKGGLNLSVLTLVTLPKKGAKSRP